MKNSDDATEKELDKILDDLRQLRNIVDYDWDRYDPSFFEKKVLPMFQKKLKPVFVC